MQPIRVKTVQESDLRMLGNLARNIQRVLPVTQADIDAAAALGNNWVVWKVFEVTEPLDNMRGGTQLIIRQNSIQPGQNVRRVIFVSGPGGQTVIVRGSEYIALPDAIANSLKYLKAFGGTEQRNLPSGYTQLEYIESTGTQYIDTGITDITNSEFEIVAQQTSITGTFPTIMGALDEDSNYKIVCGLSTSNNTFYSQCGGPNGFIVSSVPNDTQKHTFKVVTTTNQQTLQVDDTAVVIGNYAITSTTGYSLAICARNKVTVSNFTSQKVFSVRIKKSGVLVHNFIPAKNSSGVLGMYDTVSGTFFTNAGTGTFTAGPTAVPTPDAPMDIVSNNGVLKANKNLYGTEYNGYELSQVDGITLRANSGVNVSGMVDCRTIKSFKITTASPQGSFRIFKYRADNTYIDANSTASIGDIIALEDNVGFFRMQYNFTNSGTGTQNILIYNSAYDLNGIYTDGTVETISVHSKNLFGGTYETIANKYIDANGVYQTANTVDTYRYFKVRPSTTYTISGKTTRNGGMRIAEYTSNKTFVVRSAYLPDPGTDLNPKITITTTTTTEYLAMSIDKDVTDIQFERGSTATDYVPYYDGGTATAEMLLKVGDYEDVQSIIDGVVTRNIGVKVLDGTEDWTRGQSFYCNALTGVLQADHSCYCTHFQGIMNNSPVVVDSNTCRVGYHIGSDIAWDRLYIYADRSLYATAQDFANYLADQYAAGTPVIIIYPLATATTESVAGQPMQTVDGDNTAEITQASLDNLELEAKYKKQA